LILTRGGALGTPDMGIDMLRHLTTAAALAMVMTATAARATIVSGTWSFEVDAWPLSASLFNPPTPPVIGSATFSFDNSTTSEGIPAPASDFPNNFGSDLAAYSYDPGFDSLTIDFAGFAGMAFITPQFIDVSTHFIEPSVPPILHEVLFMPSLDVQIDAASFSGSFTPTPGVPEPATWAMLLLGFAGVCFAARRRCRAQPSNNTAVH
jgi:PEP-CTERM motif